DILRSACLCVLLSATLPAASDAAAASQFSVLHSFCARETCGDGQAPGLNALTPDAAGNLYGTTGAGGHRNHGTAFELVRSGDQFKYKVLYKFCPGTLVTCPAGSSPEGGVVVDAAGNLYGTTRFGGSEDNGVLYELSPPTAPALRWTEKVLYV